MGILEDIYNAVIDGKVEEAAAGVEQGLSSGIAVDDLLKKGLLSAMDLVEKGEFEQAYTMVSSSDEMSLLSSKFNYMVQRLRCRNHLVSHYDRRLSVLLLELC